LARPEDVDRIMEQLLADLEARGYHLDTGVVGTKYMLQALTEHGHADVMYEIASKRTFPSWGYWIDQGATTLWQNWDGTQSRNHVMFGSIGEWFYDTLAGIRPDPDQPGFQKIIIRPAFVDGLDWADGSYATWRGTIESAWERTRDGIVLTVSIPANTTAHIYLPSEEERIYESGEALDAVSGVSVVRAAGEDLVLKVASGRYRLSFPSP
jgi:alpha-L-rhamnosidase